MPFYPTCFAENPAGARFCWRCGKPVGGWSSRAANSRAWTLRSIVAAPVVAVLTCYAVRIVGDLPRLNLTPPELAAIILASAIVVAERR
jgi:hypothetical protein